MTNTAGGALSGRLRSVLSCKARNGICTRRRQGPPTIDRPLPSLADTPALCRAKLHSRPVLRPRLRPPARSRPLRRRCILEHVGRVIKKREAGLPSPALCRKHGLSPATFDKLKAKYGAMDLPDANRLKQLEAENAKLKRWMPDVMLDNVVLKDLLGKPKRRRCNGGMRCCGR